MSDTELARRVWNGEFGNGEERKNRIQSAGYSYSEVQAEVNRILTGKSGSSSNRKSYNTIVNEVIAGKWGNGPTRKQRLEAAGYNYSEVQRLVNQKLK